MGVALGVLLGLVLVATLAGVALVILFGMSDSLLQKWAEENGFRIVQQERRYFDTGP